VHGQRRGVVWLRYSFLLYFLFCVDYHLANKDDYIIESHRLRLQLLSVIPSELMRKKFINRMLFNDDIY